jgi:7 transmembrane receptor (rhodopsin family)
VVAACIDRWALCSSNPSLRAFSRPNHAICVILILLVVWALIPIHMAVFFNNNTGRCMAESGTYAFFHAIYSLIVIGVIPLLLMVIFSLLAWHNLQKIRSRVSPIGSVARHITIHKRDRDLMKMVSGEVIAFCITTVPYPIHLIYSVSTSSMTDYNSPLRLAIESLVGYIISPLLNLMYCCVQFYGK